jgi:flagella basal body P-ring formation protein FlgA
VAELSWAVPAEEKVCVTFSATAPRSAVVPDGSLEPGVTITANNAVVTAIQVGTLTGGALVTG